MACVLLWDCNTYSQGCRHVSQCSGQSNGSGPLASPEELPKTFDFVGEEQDIYERWEQDGCFQPAPSGTGAPFTISMPPPNVTGRLHMGHAMFVTLQDIMVRFNRMRGRPTLWLPGTDHAGIATQLVVEKMLAEEGLTRLGMGRQAFEERVWGWKRQYGDFITGQMRRLGASCDWSRERFTLDSQLSAAVREAFVRLHEKGLVYRGSYMVNWSPNLQTAVSDLEVDYTEDPGTLYYFRYPVADAEGGEHLPVATTRPETILGDTAVAVHPEDERYKHLIGRHCIVPMSGGRQIPIIGDTYVDREFGTGALKITPGHDPNDYEIGKRVGLEIINIMNNDATLNASAGAYQGLDRFEARKRLWADMEEAGLVIKQEPYTMRVPRSQRGGEVVEPLVREQWFVRMQPLAEPALQAVADGTIRILPERFQKTYNMWLENIRDWCISRQLWWGHRIPVWYVFPDEASAEASADGRSADYVVARSEEEAAEQARKRHGEGAALRQETDVLDTWFSSGLWPFSTLGWPDEAAPDLARFYPTSVMETGHDILFFWVARMIMMGLEFTGRAPFSTVFLHGLVRDGQGRKMSKSLGNVVDPVEVISEYGTDALRFTLATGTTAGQDLNLSMDRVVGSRNLTNKLWNAGKFLQMALAQASSSGLAALAAADFSRPDALAGLPLTERWMLSSLHQVVDRVTAAHEKLEFGETGRAFYDFFWSQFADWYIESAKTRLYGDDAEAAQTTRAVLVYSFRTLLALVHPIMPFVSERLWTILPAAEGAERRPLISAPWPSHSGAIDENAIAQYQALQATVGAIRNARAEYNVELGRRIAAQLAVGQADLRAALAAELDVLCNLAKLDRAQVTISEPLAEAPSSSGTIVLVVAEGLEVLLPMAGLFDVAKEVARLNKQREKAEKDLAGVAGRMANKKFMDNAPPQVVADTMRQKEEAEQKVAAIAEKIQQMSQLAA
ncbi:g3117 [Coccomyxa elongata]